MEDYEEFLKQLKHLAETGEETIASTPVGHHTTVYRAVRDEELKDIKKTGKFINRGSAEGKYFTNSAESASDYARKAVNGFGDSAYTIVKTYVPADTLRDLSAVSVDGGIRAWVIPDNHLPALQPVVLDSMPIPLINLGRKRS